ncbi:MAG: hypothetical protein ACTSRW_14290 [Candidatus Helarchaeota archaeon]
MQTPKKLAASPILKCSPDLMRNVLELAVLEPACHLGISPLYQCPTFYRVSRTS